MTDVEIARSHTVDDLCKKIADIRNVVRDDTDMLRDALHALDHGHPDVTREFLERAIRRMSAAVDRTRP